MFFADLTKECNATPKIYLTLGITSDNKLQIIFLTRNNVGVGVFMCLVL